MNKCPAGRDEFEAIEECAECPSNTECLIELKDIRECGFRVGVGVCVSSPCTNANRDICEKISIINSSLASCKNFSNIGTKDLDKCLICKPDLFEKCERSNLITKNLLLTAEEAQEIIEEQLETMLREYKGCFGKFAFDKKDCWKDCEFKVGCLRHSNILPTSNCAYFPSENNPIEEQILSEECDKCVFLKKFCSPLIAKRVKEVEIKLEATKAFNEFYSLDEMRANFMMDFTEE